MKTEAVYKQAFNAALGILTELKTKARVPSETELSRRMQVSRTTVRKVLHELADRRLISDGRQRVILAPPKRSDRFPGAETIATSRQVESRFMEWMLRGDLQPGAQVSVMKLARLFGVSTTGVREFLSGFERFGLVERRPNASWTFKGLTREFAIELFDVREIFEIKSAKAFIAQPADHPAWAELRLLRRQHELLAAELDERFQDFSKLDARLHQLVNDASANRFIRDFYDVMDFIFHYHYQWNKTLERQRNGVAIMEHLDYIDALLGRDWTAVRAAARRHLGTARQTLLASLTKV